MTDPQALPIKDDGRIVIQTDGPAWVLQGEWISCAAEYAVPEDKWR